MKFLQIVILTASCSTDRNEDELRLTGETQNSSEWLTDFEVRSPMEKGVVIEWSRESFLFLRNTSKVALTGRDETGLERGEEEEWKSLVLESVQLAAPLTRIVI